jgi:hydrocephalus-inducing protein
VKVPKGQKFNQFSIYPGQGTVAVNGSVTLNVTVVGGLPVEYNEYFVVQIGQFTEAKIPVHVSCSFAQIALDLDRLEDDPAKALGGHDLAANEVKLLIDKLSAKNAIFGSGEARVRRRGETGFRGFVFAKYCLETGMITIGETRSFDLELTSLAPFPISFEIPPTALKGSGFSIDPAICSDIPPGSKVPLKLNFDTAQRQSTAVGRIDFEVLFRFAEDLAVLLVVKTRLVLPTLTLSKTQFEFGEVIVGQTKTMTLQLQNMNSIPCEFSFGEAQFVVQKRTGEEPEPVPPVFGTNPENGILPPAAFRNIEIWFAPMNGRNLSVQIPLMVKHNNQSKNVQLNGNGVCMRVEFDPPVLTVPAVIPYGDESVCEVRMINPTSYPVEVFSHHFDFDLLCDNFRIKRLPVFEGGGLSGRNNVVSKFSICVIVHGPRVSGCSSVSRAIAKHLNVPIISLNALWGEVMVVDGNPAVDYTGKFFDRIAQSDCVDGFVVDSLDFFKNGKETDQFMTSALKGKNTYDDILLKPFTALSHSTLTAAEVALNYIVSALDGHYIFLVGVRATSDQLKERVAQMEREEKERQEQLAKIEKDTMFNMSEAEYEALSPQEKKDVDEKRKLIRMELVNTAKESMAAEAAESRSERRRGRHRERSGDKKEKETENGKKEDGRRSRRRGELPAVKSEKDVGTLASANDKKETRKKMTLPTDPHEHGVVLFNLTVGSLASRIKESCDNFQVLDPHSLKKSVNVEGEEEEEVTIPEVKALEKLNVILLDAEITREEAAEAVTQFVPKIQTLKESAFTDLIPADRVENSAVQIIPKTKYLDAPDSFCIINPDPPHEFPDFEEEMNVGQSRHGRRRSLQPPKTKPKGPLPPELVDFDMDRLTYRWHLEPKASQTLSIRFQATLIGNHKADLTFGLANCTHDLIKLPVNGFCGLPNISRDVKTIFTKRIVKADFKTELAFAQESNEFVFGPQLIAKERMGKGQAPLYAEIIHITNPTPFPSQLSLTFSESKCQWVADPQTVLIQPEATVDIKIGCHPCATDLFRTVLHLMVMDQPDPFSLNFSVEGCAPRLDTNVSAIDFDKLMLKQSRTINLELKNTSKIGAAWRFKGVNLVAPAISFPTLDGIINPRHGCVIPVTFTSPKPIVIKKPVSVEVLDKARTRIFQTIVLAASAEAFDVQFDFQYPKGMDHLQYGIVRILQGRTLACSLKNKGKFQIKYSISYDERLFDIQPSEGMVGGDRVVTINFTVKASKIMVYSNAKGINLHISDPLTNTPTGTIPIPFSCETSYSKYSLSPGKRIEFGPVTASALVTKQLILKNEGKFAFDFEITGKWDGPPGNKLDEVSAGNALRSQKKMPASKVRPRKGSLVQVGPYAICPANGNLVPDASVTVDLEFATVVAGDYSGNLILKVADGAPGEAEVPIKLHAANIMPGFVMSDLEKLFPGLMLSLRCDLVKANKTCFLEDEQVLHFQPVILQKKAAVQMLFFNKEQIPCTIDITLRPKDARTKLNIFPFDVTEKIISLEPVSSKTISIGFCPVICDSFFGIFEAVVRGATGPSRMLRFTIEGVGTLPVLSVSDGMDHGKGANFVANMGRTLLGFNKEKTVTLSNDGIIPTQITVTPKQNPCFQILDFDQIVNAVLPPQRKLCMTVVFRPLKPSREQLDISITIMDNPKMPLNLTFTGEGSSEDIVFEGLASDGEMAFKNCVVGRQQQIVFDIKNVGRDRKSVV